MDWIGLNELRERFLSFFETKGHLRLESFSLVPKDDRSLLLINSGMAPMKKYFTGEVTPPKDRVTTCQKCIRTPDLESVGITARHGTFFEMLGNFSFGDYFKKEAIMWAWEFCTNVIKLPVDRIWVSVYEKDDETFEFWNKKIGIPIKKIVKLGKKANFWEHGRGPCGPCSELYFDKGEKYSCGSKNCKPGCDCDRYIEFWNLVFTEFENNGENSYTKLKKTNIDTGMGLERLACILQDVDNIFLVDTVNEILKSVCSLSNKRYGVNRTDDISIRIITDHLRSIVFMIADGIIPSNEGRGYVLRKLIRRAMVHGKILGINDLFLHKISKVVVNQNENAYPYLRTKSEYIEKVINSEEKTFNVTIERGLFTLDNMLKNLKNDILSGEDAFKLTDTFGFPLDLAKEILGRKNIKVDLDKYNELLQNQKNMARSARKQDETNAWKISSLENTKKLKETNFLGYDEILESVSTILEVLAIDNEKEKCILILDKTPFYAESGGQVGDTGHIECQFGTFDIINTKKTNDGVFLHTVNASPINFCVGSKVKLSVNSERREAIARNHTGAHLLQSALRLVLGEHVKQAGQLVDDRKIRFDFEHFKPIAAKELEQVENVINEKIMEHLDVKVDEMNLEKAIECGATALFTEKYKNIVRVVSIGDFSKELCGGTHVKNTAYLGIFKIISEGSVSSGVRRIEAVTGINAFNYFKNLGKDIKESIKQLGGKEGSKLTDVCKKTFLELGKKNDEIKHLNSEVVDFKLGEILKNGKSLKGVFTSLNTFDNLSSNVFKTMCNKLRSKHENFLIILVNKLKDKNSIAVLVSKTLNEKNIFADDILSKILNITGGKGGGGKDYAMGNIEEMSLVDKATSNILKSL